MQITRLNEIWSYILTLQVKGCKLISDCDNSDSNILALGPTTLITLYIDVTSFKTMLPSEGKYRCIQ